MQDTLRPLAEDQTAGNLIQKSGSRERIIREAECRNITGLSRTTRYRMMRDGRFPKSIPLTGAPWCRGWLLSEVEDWVRSRAAQREAA